MPNADVIGCLRRDGDGRRLRETRDMSASFARAADRAVEDDVWYSHCGPPVLVGDYRRGNRGLIAATENGEGRLKICQRPLKCSVEERETPPGPGSASSGQSSGSPDEARERESGQWEH